MCWEDDQKDNTDMNLIPIFTREAEMDFNEETATNHGFEKCNQPRMFILILAKAVEPKVAKDILMARETREAREAKANFAATPKADLPDHPQHQLRLPQCHPESKNVSHAKMLGDLTTMTSRLAFM